MLVLLPAAPAMRCANSVMVSIGVKASPWPLRCATGLTIVSTNPSRPTRADLVAFLARASRRAVRVRALKFMQVRGNLVAASLLADFPMVKVA